MSEFAIISVIALVGWLVLVLGAYRAHRVGMQRTVIMSLIWGGSFLFLAMIFTVIGW
jgi:hypothetical protein